LSVEQELRLLRIVREAGGGRAARCRDAAGPPCGSARVGSLRVGPAGGPGADGGGGSPGRSRMRCIPGERSLRRARSRAALEAGAHAGWSTPARRSAQCRRAEAQLAAELECASADHLVRITRDGIEALARAGTTAVLLPLAAWFLRDPRPAQRNPCWTPASPSALGSNHQPGKPADSRACRCCWLPAA